MRHGENGLLYIQKLLVCFALLCFTSVVVFPKGFLSGLL